MSGYSQSDESFVNHAFQPLLRWLIVAAVDGQVLTYGQVASRLTSEVGFAPITVPRRMGVLAGMLMSQILETDPRAPLINLLVVNKQTKLPGNKAGEIISERLGRPEIAESTFAERDPDEWRNLIGRYTAEVRRYSIDQWLTLYQSLGWPNRLTGADIAADLAIERVIQTDYSASGRAGEGEGQYHRYFREWVTQKPEAISAQLAGATTRTEFDLLSGDRIDMVARTLDLTAVVEVKSRKSNPADLLRGVYQCIKYRAVLSAQELCLGPNIEAWLITEEPPEGRIKVLLNMHDIKHRVIRTDLA